jgi:hypothetical protein
VDLIVRHARLRDRDGLCDVGIRGERVAAIADGLEATATIELDADGRLLAPTYVNGHVHLDASSAVAVSRRAPPTCALCRAEPRLCYVSRSPQAPGRSLPVFLEFSRSLARAA